MELLNTISRSRLWTNHGLKLVWGLAILWFLVVISTITLDTTSTHRIKLQNYSSQTIEPIKRAGQANYSVQDIISANLFGDPTPKKIAITPKPTTLNLSLDGLLWASDSSTSRAIIASGKKKPELYSIGQEIIGASGVSIKEIQPDEVILNRNGLAESLPLVKSTISGNRKVVVYNVPSSNAPDDYDAYTKSLTDAQRETDGENN